MHAKYSRAQANPTALTLSGVMMLRHLNLNAHADKIEKAMLSVIAEGKVMVLVQMIPSPRADDNGRPGRHEQVLRVHAGRVRPHPLTCFIGLIACTSELELLEVPGVALAGKHWCHDRRSVIHQSQPSIASAHVLAAAPGAASCLANWVLLMSVCSGERRG